MTTERPYKLCQCGCGKKVYQKHNSTIFNKLTPNCQLKKAYTSRKPDKSEKQYSPKKPAKKKFNFYATAAWKYCSHYVLLFYANDDLMVQCSTNSKLYYHITDRRMHCGHFIKTIDGSNTYYSTALLFENLGPQSSQENNYMGGRPDVMRQWLIDQHGIKEIEKIEILKYNICKPDQLYFEYWAKYWKKKYQDLLTEKGIKDPWKK